MKTRTEWLTAIEKTQAKAIPSFSHPPLDFLIALFVFLTVTANSLAVARVIAVSGANVPPVLSAIELTNLSYSEGQAATAITATINVTDADNATLSGGTVQITGNFLSTEDVLSFAGAPGITASYDALTGTLTLSGTTTLANYRTALRAVRYQNTNTNNPSNLLRTVSFSVTDGVDISNIVNRNIAITPINDAPVLSSIEAATLPYTEEQPATPITSTLAITDVDNVNIASATVQITTNYNNGQDVLAFVPTFGITSSFNAASGLLTLTGPASLADFETALRSVTYVNTNAGNPVTTVRTVTFRVNDGSVNSNTITRTITITPVNDAPVLSAIEGTALAYSEGQAATAITATINATDVDNTNLSGATVQITGNYTSTEDILTFTTVSGITGLFDAATGTMTLTGTTSVTNYRNALRTVRYQNTNNGNPSTAVRTINFRVSDGALVSAGVTRDIAFTAVNDAPVLSAIEPGTLSYTEDQGPLALTASLVATDVDNTTLSSATIQITANYSSTQDRLAFTDAYGITGSFNSATGMLTLTGVASIADYELAIRSVTYENINTVNPSTAIRTVTFRVNDGTANSNTQTRTITLSLVNDAPILAAMEGADMVYTEGQAATSITATTTVTDLDNANLVGATIQITGNYLTGEDVLSFTPASGITGTWDAATGTMTLSGSSSVANYQTAIRNVRYNNTNNATPSPLTRTVSFEVRDAALSSNVISRNIAVVPVNDAPTVVNDAATLDEETSVVIDVLANDIDVDNTIDPTTVAIVLMPVNGTVSVDPLTGAVTYTPDANFSGTNTFRYTVRDVSGATSSSALVTITVNNINDTPVFTKGPDITVLEDAGTQTIAGWATGIDDGDPFTSQTLTFVLTNDNNGLFASQPSVNAAGNLTFRSANHASGLATVTIYLRDNGLSTAPHVNASATQTFTIRVLSVNDPPTAVDDFYSTSSNTPLIANLRTNDSDRENNTLTVSPVPIVPPTKGTVDLQPGGVFTYTPNSGSSGTDSFTYEICDDGTDNGVPAPRCGQAVVTVTINPPNSYYNIVGNNSIQVATHCFILTKALNNQQGAVWNRTPLDLRYSFNLNFETMFSDSSVVRDNGADGIIFLLQRDTTPPPLNVLAPPIEARGAVGEYLGVGGISPSIGIEVDTYQNAGEPTYDHLAISRDGSVYNIVAPATPAKVDSVGAAINIEDGQTHTVRIAWDKITNTLTVDFDGVQRLAYSADMINDIFGGDPTNIYWGFSASTGGQNNYQAVCGIDFAPINLVPVAMNDSVTTNEDTQLDGQVLSNDSDPEEGALTVYSETKATAHGSVVIRGDGTYTYTPISNYFGQDSFTYQVCDDFVSPQCSIGTVYVSVTPVNDPPIALDDSDFAVEDSQVVIDVLNNDTDVDNAIDPNTTTIVTAPVHGTATVDAAGFITYTPNPDFYGSDIFTYTVRDQLSALSNSASVAITITPVNDAPVAVDDQVITRQVAVPIAVLQNDRDPEDGIDPASLVITVQPTHGTLAISNGVVTYLPDTDYLGNDLFSYQMSDVDGLLSNIANVAIQVTPANRAPVAVDDGPITFSLYLPLTIDVLANDSDPDHDQSELSIVSVSTPSAGNVTIENGFLIFTPAALTESGEITFTYTISDPEGLTSEATVTLYYAHQPLTISEGFSPNGDGSNDRWYIRSIENFPSNSLRVYNRWGLMVYQMTHYNNSDVAWDGRANVGGEAGKLLDYGTYYYTLDLADGSKPMSGFVFIAR